jgi:hypothetical protein
VLLLLHDIIGALLLMLPPLRIIFHSVAVVTLSVLLLLPRGSC